MELKDKANDYSWYDTELYAIGCMELPDASFSHKGKDTIRKKFKGVPAAALQYHLMDKLGKHFDWFEVYKLTGKG